VLFRSSCFNDQMEKTLNVTWHIRLGEKQGDLFVSQTFKTFDW
jgi:hypothetical protein